MKQRVPDEYFRPHAESDDVSSGSPRRRPEPSGVKAVPASKVRDGITARALAIILVLTFALAYVVGRLFVFPAVTTAAPASPAPSATAPGSATATSTPDPLAPYDGNVVPVTAANVTGECLQGWSANPPSGLIDNEATTYWSCDGSGVIETLVFEFDRSVDIVGMRIVNGNTVVPDRYLAERRILSVRWTFSDGSYFDQGLAASNRSLQEVRIPAHATGSVMMQILDSTPSGTSSADANQVSISALEFLERG